jgi:hypothetical protein
MNNALSIVRENYQDQNFLQLHEKVPSEACYKARQSRFLSMCSAGFWHRLPVAAKLLVQMHARQEFADPSFSPLFGATLLTRISALLLIFGVALNWLGLLSPASRTRNYAKTASLPLGTITHTQ